MSNIHPRTVVKKGDISYRDKKRSWNLAVNMFFCCENGHLNRGFYDLRFFWANLHWSLHELQLLAQTFVLLDPAGCSSALTCTSYSTAVQGCWVAHSCAALWSKRGGLPPNVMWRSHPDTQLQREMDEIKGREPEEALTLIHRQKQAYTQLPVRKVDLVKFK